MVLGLRTKTRRSRSVQLDYIIHIQEIKPWPPSQSLRTLRSVLIQWEHGEKTSGLTNQVVPSLGTGSGVGDGRIEFNESIRLSVTLMREMSIKDGNGDTFQKNCIEFNLYEPRRDKTVKGQLLGTAVLDLADYGVIRENLAISAPINCKRTYRNTVQPLIFLEIHPVERTGSSTSSRDSLMREASMDSNRAESVSALMSEEYAEEAEVASFTTDDDVCSQSSLVVTSSAAESNGSSSPQNKENGAVTLNGRAGDAEAGHISDQCVAKSDKIHATESHVNSAGNSSRSSSIDLSSDLAWISKKITSQSFQFSVVEETAKQQSSNMKSNEHVKEAERSVVNGGRDVKIPLTSKDNTIAKKELAELDQHSDKHLDSVVSHRQNDKNLASSPGPEDLLVSGRTKSLLNGFADDRSSEKHKNNAEDSGMIEEKRQQIEDKTLCDFSQADDVQNQITLENGLRSSTKDKVAVNSTFPNIAKHVKSVRSSMDPSKSNGSTRSNQSFVADTVRGSISSEWKDTKLYTKETRNLLSDSRIQHLEHKIKNLEGELREAAGIEVSLYSVVAEHGSSMAKVHAPARRLSRLYFHASKQNSKPRRGSAAKSVVSGLALVAKACGNDVPRLTFWLSNSIVLRVIINKSFGDNQLPISKAPVVGTLGDRNRKNSSPLKWESFPSKITRNSIDESFGDWENPLTFAAALEKVEAWIFSRIIESLWWQTFTPHMQSGAAKAIRKSMNSDSSKLYRRTSSSMDEQQGNFSLELWKKAFKDACERICPVRAGGHDCGCLPLLSRLIMEQLIARLDVAMFNAILRESADEIPTDPIADPISDAEVLPIPSGKASFGTGAQLKNAIGTWSRWLTDLFGIDDDDLLESENCTEDARDEEKQRSCDTSSKSFHLLNALSDLMMLPKDMLLSRTIRKEVCPTFGPPLIRRVLNSFNPDEFCPDPIPVVVLEALNSEDPFDTEEDCIMNFPCAAAPIVYQTPSVASVAIILGDIGNHSQLKRSGSLVLRKSQTSDDELDELDSPLKSMILDSFSPSPTSVKSGLILKENGSRNTVRYQLLREVWLNSE
ncbi:hypothetical protein BUALT_Bualt04G0171700 [Buddleja alternifolia]|uniref:C2 NT-type domain-containing protein n=1 Tax=Buddleja alternifolia TaxID=168488 RepID=A0AAV6Y0J0_9LAMI|nr:hypothetical protein BUALT_Bualt04G0171700 [Buddleja alternifolia]